MASLIPCPYAFCSLLVGAAHYAAHPVGPLDKVMGAINLDTVGRLGSGKVAILGAGTATEWPHIFRGASFVTGVESSSVAGSYEASDQRVFIERGVPAVQVFTGPHADYHRPPIRQTGSTSPNW